MDSFFLKIILNEFCKIKIIGTHWLIFVQQSGTYQVKLAAFIFGAEQAKHPVRVAIQLLKYGDYDQK